jgi:hypothetical protein
MTILGEAYDTLNKQYLSAESELAQLRKELEELRTRLSGQTYFVPPEFQKELEAAKHRITELSETCVTHAQIQNELLAEKEALEKKLAEQQVCIEEMLDTLRISGAPKLAIIMSGLNKQGTEELTKREAAARQQGFEEGKRIRDELVSDTAFKAGKQVGRDEVMEAIYPAWHGAGVDIAGGDWNRFVSMLPTAPVQSHAISRKERNLTHGKHVS